MRNISVFVCVFVFFSLNAQIVIDEDFQDWENSSLIQEDKANDGVYGIDFTNIRINNDDKYLYLLFNTTKEINLQSNNDIALFIDIDEDENTGYKINGMGADISYFFGARYGFYYRNGSSIQIYHNDIGLISLPTVTSDTFEMAIKREFKIGSYLIKLPEKIKLFLLQDTQNGDKIPDNQGGLEYTMGDNKFILPAFEIDKKNDDDIRIMSYNVEKDHYFDNEPPYRRLIKAGRPDILCFQEIYKHSSTTVRNKIQLYFGGNWYDAKIGSDLIVVSKYPIVKTKAIGGNGAFLINKSGKEILIINNHLYCCDNDSGRQKEVDEIMQFIRRAKSNQGTFTISKNTAVIILGDMNFVGSNRQRKTLIEGDILNEYNYGSDFLPDWDGTVFEDAKPITTGYPGTFTWNSDNSSYPKGRLDYVIYSGSVLQKQNGFALFTRLLSRDILEKYQMNAEDTDNASDHFPVFVDFKIIDPMSVNENIKSLNDFIVSCYPNPVKNTLNIDLKSKEYSGIYMSVIDNSGRTVIEKHMVVIEGFNKFKLDMNSLNPGIYYLRIYKPEKSTPAIKSLKIIID